MLNTHDEVVKQIRQRALAHKLEAERAEKIDMGLRIPASLLACVLAATNTVAAVIDIATITYVNCAVSLLVAMLTAVMSALQTFDKIRKHTDASKNYERVFNRCTAEFFRKHSDEEYAKLVEDLEAEVQMIVQASPIVSTWAESKSMDMVASSFKLQVNNK